MAVITDTIDLCSCSHSAELAHDAYGCAREDCECLQTAAQLLAVQALRGSIELFAPRL